MPAKRPAGITALALVNIIFGSLGLLCVCCGAVGQVGGGFNMQQSSGGQTQQFDQAALEKHMNDKVPGYKVVQWGGLGLSLLMSVVLLASGVGLWQMQAWGRFAAIGYGVVQVLVQLGMLVYNIAFVAPAAEEFFATTPLKLPGWMFALTSLLSAAISILLAMVILVWAALPATGRALSGAGAAGPASEDYFDEGYHRERSDLPRDEM
jgi:hypothetical protein